MPKPFTLVSTVFNEASRLSETLSDISSQSLLPDEVIITDAGSSDGTVDILNAWAATVPFSVKVLSWPRCNVAQGRNKAIEEAKHALILSTDFGCRFHPDWIKSVISPFNNDYIEVVGGAYSVIEKDIQTLPAKANYIICNGYECHPQSGFIPSSRSIAYYKSVWEEAGKYPEWLTLAADDLLFGMVVLHQKHSIAYASDSYVFWGRHKTLKAYGKEAFRYGLGDGEARVNKREFISKFIETAIRYTFPVYATACLIYWNMLGFNPWLIAPGVLWLAGFRSNYKAFKNWLHLKSDKYDWKTLLYTIPVIEATRINYLKGYATGYTSKRREVREQSLIWKQKYSNHD